MREGKMIMSRIKNLVSIIIVAALFLQGGNGLAIGNKLVSENEQDAFVSYYSELINYFGINEKGETQYDQYFAGGAFIDNQLVIYVKDGNEDAIAEYRSLAGECGIVFEKVDHSLLELIDIQGNILKCLDGPETLVCGISYSKNKVIVRSENSNQILCDYISLNGLADCVEIRTGDVHVELTSLHGGDSSSTAGATIGWCGTYNNSPAILTCAHGNYAYSSISVFMEDVNNSTTATKAISCYDCLPDPLDYNGMSVPEPVGDYYIATVNNGLTTNDFHSGTSGTLIDCSSYIPTVPEGTIIHMYGNFSKGHTATTHETNVVIRRTVPVGPINNQQYYVFWGLILASFNDSQTQNGDSGGPVWYHFTSSGTNAATGTITGIITHGSEACFAYSPIKYAVAQGFSVRTW